MNPAGDSVASLCDHIGVGPVAECLRAVDRHSDEGLHVWIVLHDGQRMYHHDRAKLDKLPAYTRLASVGVGGIAWDGSDWEYSEEVSAGDGWTRLDQARLNFSDALIEHREATA
jgi:hypothetical protein